MVFDRHLHRLRVRFFVFRFSTFQFGSCFSRSCIFIVYLFYRHSFIFLSHLRVRFVSICFQGLDSPFFFFFILSNKITINVITKLLI